MQPPANKLTFWYQKPLLWIAVGLSLCAAFLAMPTAQRFYYQWTGERKVQRAAVAFAKGDYDTAILNARGALATNNKDLEALRIMAKMADATGSPQALDFRRQIEAIDPNDAENRLGLIEANLKAGNIKAAADALSKVPTADQVTVRYHDIAAGIALALRNTADFESHTEEASKLAPADDSYQLKLAKLRLTAKSPELRAGALATLDQLKTKPATASAALRALVRDSLDRGEKERAIEFANALAASPGASVGDKLTRLSALTAAGVSKNSFYLRLGELQKETAAEPEGIAQVVAWMNAHHLSLQVPEWVASLPVDLVSKPPVCVAVAESHALASNWAKLRESLEGVSWEKLDYLRFAFLSRACERLGDAGGAATAWNRALETAQANPAALQRLITEINTWGWEEKTEDALKKLVAKGHHPRWAAEALWSAALKKGDTPGLYNASKLLLQADPKSVVARTHFIFLALITQQDEAAVHPLAESLYKENPAVADSALAFAFSLFRQNRPEEAVTVFSKLPPEKLAEPRLAFYQGLFLTVAGRPDEAEKSLQLAAETPLLPEMEALRRILMPAFEAKRFDRDGKRVECDRAWDAAIAAAGTRPDWLEILARVAIAWNWESKAGVVLNKLATAGRCPAWAIPTLWAVSLKSGDSAEIYQAAKLVLAANPKDFAARNNFIAVALLTGKSADSPHQLAEALHAENPANPDAAATHCLSLYRQGKLESALAVLRQLKPEQLQQPRPARYHGLVLAALGQPEEAAPALSAGATGPMLPEEKALVETLEMAFQWRAVQQGADLPAADAAWKKALSAAQRRPEMLETLGRMLLKWEASEKASEVMWKLTGTPQCPRWVIDQLWADAEKQRNTTQLYQLSRLLRRASPEDVTCRSNFVRFSLLTGQDADFPHRLADALLDENPGNPEVAATSALSLLQRKKAKEAVAVFAALKPEQLKNPRVAYYYGLALTASGQAEKARTYLEKGSEKPLLPEEERLLAEVNSTSAAHLGR